MKRGELRKLSDSARRKVSRNLGFRQSGYINSPVSCTRRKFGSLAPLKRE